MIKAVIFDAGKVIFRSENSKVRKDISDTLLVPLESVNWFWQEYIPLLGSGKITETQFWQSFYQELRPTVPLPKHNLLSRQFKSNFYIYRGTQKVIQELKKAGYRLAVLSNTIEAHNRVMIEKKAFVGFEVIVLSNEVGFRKPGPEIYQITLDKLGVKPEEAIFIDDLPENISTAEKLGIKGILFTNSRQLRKQLLQLNVSINKN